MAGTPFDALITRLSRVQLNRLRLLQGVTAATAVTLTSATMAPAGTDATGRTRTICHCGDTNPDQVNCVTKRLKKDKARQHLRRYRYDYTGRCAKNPPLVQCSGACVPDRDVCCPPGSKQSGTCQKSINACNED